MGSRIDRGKVGVLPLAVPARRHATTGDYPPTLRVVPTPDAPGDDFNFDVGRYVGPSQSGFQNTQQSQLVSRILGGTYIRHRV